MARFLLAFACTFIAASQLPLQAKASPAAMTVCEIKPDAYSFQASNGNGMHPRPFAAERESVVIETSSKNDEGRGNEYFISRNTEAARLHSEGRYSEAEEVLKPLLMEAMETLGDDHKYTALTALNFAEISIIQGDYADAVKYLELVVKAYKKQIGPDHVQTANVLSRLASVYLSKGHLREAEAVLEEVLHIRQRALGAMHPDSLIVLDALGGINYSQGRFRNARRLYQEALNGFEQTIGPMHQQSVRTRRNLNQARMQTE